MVVPGATLLVGREKLGKSTLTAELAARLSRGTLEGDLRGTHAATLIVTYEDSAGRTIKPRLMAAGADLSRVHRVSAQRDGGADLVTLPADVDSVAALAAETEARLVIVDPLSASLGADVDGHRDQDIRRALAPLVALAANHRGPGSRGLSWRGAASAPAFMAMRPDRLGCRRARRTGQGEVIKSPATQDVDRPIYDADTSIPRRAKGSSATSRWACEASTTAYHAMAPGLPERARVALQQPLRPSGDVRATASPSDRRLTGRLPETPASQRRLGRRRERARGEMDLAI